MEITQENAENSIEKQQYITLPVKNITKDKDNLKLTDNKHTGRVIEKSNLPMEQKKEDKIINSNKSVENLNFKAVKEDISLKKDEIMKKESNSNDTFIPVSLSEEKNRLKENSIPSCKETQRENKQ